MRRVSFKIAKALKDAGYLQNDLSFWYDRNGTIFTIHPKEGTEYYVAPSYLEVGLWLWRAKDIKIVVSPNCLCIWIGLKYVNLDSKLTNDPEEAIIAALEYLVDNDLIK